MAKRIPIRGVPEVSHRTSKARAARDRKRLSDYLKKEAEIIARRPTMQEWLDRVSKNKPIRLGKSAAEIIRESRGE